MRKFVKNIAHEINVHDTTVSEVQCYLYLQLGHVIKGALYMGSQRKLVSINLHSEIFKVVALPSSLSWAISIIV